MIKDALVRLCIPTLGLHDGQIKVIKTPHHPGLFHDAELPAWRAAAASTAAPTYFVPFELRGYDAYLDGGLWANNPSLVAIAEARQLGFDLSEIELLSIGTCQALIAHDPQKAKSWGFAGWGKHLFSLVSGAQQQAVHHQVRYLGVQSYLRISPDVSPSLIAMDNPNTCMQLVPIAEREFQSHFKSLEESFLDSVAQSWR